MPVLETRLFTDRPLVIAHRGASGLLPEQTIEALNLAVDQGADAVELDVVAGADGTLIVRHESELSLTTDVALHPEFNSRRTTKTIDGEEFSGWFTEDFTSSEIDSLRARQRFPFRARSSDDLFAVPTLDKVVQWLVARRARERRPIGLFIEIKHPSYFASIGVDMAARVFETLKRHELSRRSDGVCVMSFEASVLRKLRSITDVPLAQLLDGSHTFTDFLTPTGLQAIATYADGIGPSKRLIVPDESNAQPTSLVREAHDAGLFVCPWTFRDEAKYLAPRYAGDAASEYREFYGLDVDGVISDFPRTALDARIVKPWGLT
jgi:glycerophosphoryl diester phosphodiesterase